MISGENVCVVPIGKGLKLVARKVHDRSLAVSIYTADGRRLQDVVYADQGYQINSRGEKRWRDDRVEVTCFIDSEYDGPDEEVDVPIRLDLI